jgi:hypothetical protein
MLMPTGQACPHRQDPQTSKYMQRTITVLGTQTNFKETENASSMESVFSLIGVFN